MKVDSYHKCDICGCRIDDKTYDPSTGTENKFEVRRVQWFDEEKEEQNDIQRNGD